MESPFKAPTLNERSANIAYLRAALRDCLLRGDAPFASHAIYTLDGVLDDGKLDERQLGIAAGLLWGNAADATVVYVDRGISEGMLHGIEHANRCWRSVEFRSFNKEGRGRLVDAPPGIPVAVPEIPF